MEVWIVVDEYEISSGVNIRRKKKQASKNKKKANRKKRKTKILLRKLNI